MSFKKLKRNRLDVNALIEKAKDAEGGQSRKTDERMWYPQRDKAGNGYAVIRFLPGLEADEGGSPWAQYWDHGFKGPTGQWYIEKSLTTLGQPDPVGELNQKMWNNPSDFGLDEEEAKKIVRDRKRGLHYVTNVYIVSDPANPENEGQVKLFRFGKKIFDKIKGAMVPEFPDESPINPFDLWEGADFVIKIRMQDRYPNYDQSVFKSPSEFLGGDEAALEAVYDQQFSLTEFTDPATFKSYEELKSRLDMVLGESAPRTTRQRSDLENSKPPQTQKQAPAPTLEEELDGDTVETVGGDADDDMMDYFKGLVNDDD